MSAHDHLNMTQFGPTMDNEGWLGPLGSFGDPATGITGWQGTGVMPDAGSGI